MTNEELNRELNHGNIKSVRVISTSTGKTGFTFERVYVISTKDYICVRTTGNVLVGFHKISQTLANFPNSFTGHEKSAALAFLRRVLINLGGPSQVVNQPPSTHAYGQQPPPYYPPPAGTYQPPPPAYAGIDQNPYGGYQPYQGTGGGGVVQPTNIPAAPVDQDTETRYKSHHVDNRAIYYAAFAALAILVGVVVVQGLYIHSVMLSTNDLALKHDNTNVASGQRFENIETHFNANDKKMDGKLVAQENKLFTVSESLVELRSVVNENAVFAGKALGKAEKTVNDQSLKLIRIEEIAAETRNELKDYKVESDRKFANSDRQHARHNERIKYLYSEIHSGKKVEPPIRAIESSSFQSYQANAGAISTVVKSANSSFDVDTISTYIGYIVMSFITLVFTVNMANVCLNGKN